MTPAHQRQTWNFSKEEIKDSSRNQDSQNASQDGFEPVTLWSIIQRGTTEQTTAVARLASNLYYLCNNLVMQLSIFAITIPPRTPGDMHQNVAPFLGLLHPGFCPGGGFVGSSFICFKKIIIQSQIEPKLEN